MEKLQKRSSDVMSPVDRISDLPDSILCHILSFLPTWVSVASGILSRRWKYLWTKVPALDFDAEDYRGNNERVNFVKFVNMVLLHQDAGHLKKFHLKWWERCEEGYVNIWVSSIITRNVRVLVLDIKLDHDNLTCLPGRLYTCGTVEFLTLHGDITVYVPSVVCLPKLEVLNLISLYYESDETLHKLISGCPVLHSLKIERNGRVDNLRALKIAAPSLRRLQISLVANSAEVDDGKLEIDAPNLEFLAVEDHTLKECSVTGLPSVNTVELYLEVDPEPGADPNDGPFSTDGCNSIVKLVEGLNHVNILRLSGNIMKALSNVTISFSACFGRLTKLDILCECCQWSSLDVMLGYSIGLESLNITMVQCVKDTHTVCWKEPKQVPKCLLCSLSHISFSGFMGVEDQIAVIRYILKHGVVLKSVHVKSGVDPSDLKNKFEMIKKIAMFPRYSRVCELKFD